jgi:cytochrome oxidase Cu insertion factor (SCO1/SenC/PrrC family)
MSTKQEQLRSRAKLIILISIFILPIVAAYILHKKPEWQPKSTKNFGVLYKPTVKLNGFSLQTQDNKAFTLADMQGKWSLVYIGGGNCDQQCQQTLIKARDARLAQGTEATRINYYYIVAADRFTDDVQTLSKQHHSLVLLQGTAEQRNAVIQQFRIDKTHQPGGDNRLYLVDPAGMVFLYYPFGFEHVGLMEDLRHLLKWSQIG